MIRTVLGTLVWTLTAGLGVTLEAAAQAPTATLSNGQLTVTISLPDAQQGYYRGTRFDWSGIISSLKYKGHEYVTPWSQIYDPAVEDYEFRGDQIATGAAATMVGFPEEFMSMPAKTAQGFDEAPVGGTFIKIGAGVLRRPDDKPYSHFRTYEIVDGTQWSVKKTATSISFTQTIHDRGSGYGYVYTKTIALVPGKAELTLQHTLRNTGSKPITGAVYDHNFTRWDNETPGPDYSMHFAFDAKPSRPPGENPLVVYSGRAVTFTHLLSGKEALRSEPVGFGNDAKDYDFRFENTKLGIGLHVTADRPLTGLVIWGIHTAFALEPWIGYDIQPGAAFGWKYDYQAYELAAAK
jgi:hypothetical protein